MIAWNGGEERVAELLRRLVTGLAEEVGQGGDAVLESGISPLDQPIGVEQQVLP